MRTLKKGKTMRIRWHRYNNPRAWAGSKGRLHARIWQDEKTYYCWRVDDIKTGETIKIAEKMNRCGMLCHAKRAAEKFIAETRARTQ